MTNQHPTTGRFTPVNVEAQPKAVRPTAQGQERTGGPTGQSRTGPAAEGRFVNDRPVAGQSTAPRHPSKPNR
jgi:hypothetical protein